MYMVANASEYLLITGFRINGIKIAKKGWIHPGQRCFKFNISPVNYSVDVQAMSSEKLPFVIPAVYTIGPRADDHQSLLKYVKLITPIDNQSEHVVDLVVKGVIEGETRIVAESMTMEEILKVTKNFKNEVIGRVELVLSRFGLVIYNTNVKQLVDVPGHDYLSHLGQKIQQEAAKQAKMKGEIEAKLGQRQTMQIAQRQGQMKKEEVKVLENQREAEANGKLTMKKAKRGLRILWRRLRS